jgi:hypothetical protein
VDTGAIANLAKMLPLWAGKMLPEPIDPVLLVNQTVVWDPNGSRSKRLLKLLLSKYRINLVVLVPLLFLYMSLYNRVNSKTIIFDHA